MALPSVEYKPGYHHIDRLTTNRKSHPQATLQAQVRNSGNKAQHETFTNPFSQVNFML